MVEWKVQVVLMFVHSALSPLLFLNEVSDTIQPCYQSSLKPDEFNTAAM